MTAKLGYNPGRRFTQLYLTTENVNGQIKAREAKLRDYKLTKAREWMDVLSYGLLECSEKGTVVATLCHALIGSLSTKTTQQGGPRAHYPGGSHFKSLPVEAERKVEAEQQSNEDRTGGIPSHPLPHRAPQKVSSKRDTTMDDQRKSTPAHDQDPHITKPVTQHVGLVHRCRTYSPCSVLTIYRFDCRGVRFHTPPHNSLSQGPIPAPLVSETSEHPKRSGKRGFTPADHTDRLDSLGVGPSTYSFLFPSIVPLPPNTMTDVPPPSV